MRRRKSYGLPPEGHADRAKSTLREIRRLLGVFRSRMKSPPDCIHAAHLLHTLAQQEGAYLIDRHDSGARRWEMAQETSRRALDRFVKVCVVHSHSKAADRKIHAVWR